jgi:hypothetical protein
MAPAKILAHAEAQGAEVRVILTRVRVHVSEPVTTIVPLEQMTISVQERTLLLAISRQGTAHRYGQGDARGLARVIVAA